MAEEETAPKWGINWLLSPTGMSQVAQIIILLIALVKAFQNGDKADEAKDHAAAAAQRVEDVKKDVGEVHADVEQVKKVQTKVLMNQIKPE